ncbi:hypothetical protein QBC43DRAFT_338161 [Cladorrhinum sp. PSN259]|nr:hypothetical protein QBC43DRAFT_338161 [Cladorrhinum sp. PSN259]
MAISSSTKKGPNKLNGEQRSQSNQQPKHKPNANNDATQQNGESSKRNQASSSSSKQKKKSKNKNKGKEAEKAQEQPLNPQTNGSGSVSDEHADTDLDIEPASPVPSAAGDSAAANKATCTLSSSDKHQEEFDKRHMAFFESVFFTPNWMVPSGSRCAAPAPAVASPSSPISKSSRLVQKLLELDASPMPDGTPGCARCPAEMDLRKKAVEIAKTLDKEKAEVVHKLLEACVKVSQLQSANSFASKTMTFPPAATGTSTGTGIGSTPSVAPNTTTPKPAPVAPMSPPLLAPAAPASVPAAESIPLTGTSNKPPLPPPPPPPSIYRPPQIPLSIPSHLVSLRTFLTLQSALHTLSQSLSQSQAFCTTIDSAFAIPESRGPYTQQINIVFETLQTFVEEYQKFVEFWGRKCEKMAGIGCRDLILPAKVWQVIKALEGVCLLWEGQVLGKERVLLSEAGSSSKNGYNWRLKKMWEGYQGCLMEFGRVVEGGLLFHGGGRVDLRGY